jgi:uncharacterized membrane protein
MEVALPDRVHHFNSEYSLDISNYLYYISTALQGWVFAMRYLQSSVECSLAETCLTTGCVKYTGWGVGIGYTTVITVLIMWLMISFPGWYLSNGSMNQFYDWFHGLYTKLYTSNNAFWTSLTIMSTITTIYAICKIFAINRELSLTNPNVKINKKSMVLHSTLLIIQCFVVFLANVSYFWAPRFYNQLLTVLPMIDMIVQLLICYICFTLGASDQLTRFDCYLIEDGQGNFIVKYKLKEWVPEAIGEAYVANIPT